MKNYFCSETFYFDLFFDTNRRQAAYGFSCSVSCDEKKKAEAVKEWECRCGVPNRVQKIVGGEGVESNEYPWQVGITSPGSTRPWCGGSVLTTTSILTAAHCTRGTGVEDMIVIVGEHDWSQEDGQERYRVCAKTEHPQHNRRTQDKDFSILTLCKELTFRREVQPICLPSSGDLQYEDVPATVSGWGTLSSGGVQPHYLMEVNVTTISNADCDATYKSITPSMLCTKEKGKDACQGDSGGPLITQESEGYYSQIGVVSWGIGCAHDSRGGKSGKSCHPR